MSPEVLTLTRDMVVNPNGFKLTVQGSGGVVLDGAVVTMRELKLLDAARGLVAAFDDGEGRGRVLAALHELEAALNRYSDT